MKLMSERMRWLRNGFDRRVWCGFHWTSVSCLHAKPLTRCSEREQLHFLWQSTWELRQPTPKLFPSHSHALNRSMYDNENNKAKGEVSFHFKKWTVIESFLQLFSRAVVVAATPNFPFLALPCPCVINLSSFIREEIIIFWWLFMTQHLTVLLLLLLMVRKIYTFPRSHSRKIFFLKCFSCFVFVAVDI